MDGRDDPNRIDHELLDSHSAAVDIRDRTLSASQRLSASTMWRSAPMISRALACSLILMFDYGTGLRASELVAGLTGQLRHYVGDDNERYDMLVVRGKGRRIRSVPMPPPVMTALAAYFKKRGLDPNPYAHGKFVRLIGLLRAKKVSQANNAKALELREAGLELTVQVTMAEPGLTAGGLYDVLKDCVAGVAAMLDSEGKPDDASKLQAASTHWLRHVLDGSPPYWYSSQYD